jgi:hypothetical protein
MVSPERSIMSWLIWIIIVLAVIGALALLRGRA